MAPRIYQAVVFSDGPGGGNPCPIVLGDESFSPEDVRALAAEFMAETVLIIAPEKPEAGFQFRFFVPRQETEMCVHGTIAAVTLLHALGKVTTSPLQIETALGRIAVDWETVNGGILVTVNQFPPVRATKNPTAREVAEVLGLSDDSLIRSDLPLVSVSTARFKLIVPLKQVQTLHRLEPDFNALWSLCQDYGTTGLYPFAPLPGTKNTYAARQFPRRAGYNEDPATGVAAGALGAYLTTLETSPDGWNTFEIFQGQAMGRPSRITVKTWYKSGSVRKVCVTGKAEITGPGPVQKPG